MKRQLWNDGWTFFTESSPNPVPVTLPHDAMLHGERSPLSPGKDAMGYFTGDIYHYKKIFKLSDTEVSHAILLFDGVFQNVTVKLNGKTIGSHHYGYTPFEVVLDSALSYDKENELEVIADNSNLPNSRWYTGGGIYRDVYLLTSAEKYIRPNGVKIDTVSINPPTIRIQTALSAEPACNESVHIEIMDNGKKIATAMGTDSTIILPNAALWSDEKPKLYSAVITLSDGNKVLDSDAITFGIRKLAWSTDGFFVNDKNTLLRGGCIHHDNGILGSCSYYEAELRKIHRLKESGYNAVRIAHNPASKALLDACDECGMYVMDEAFDMWYAHKNKYDYAAYFMDDYESDITAMVEHDYNHPSVIMYSIGNEVSEPAKPEGVEIAIKMRDLIRSLDASRPVTAGINFMILMLSSMGKGLYDEGGLAAENANKTPENKTPEKEKKSGSLMFNTMMTVMGKGINRVGNSKKADLAASPVLDTLDIAGYNYANGRYKKEGQKHPNRIILGSETYPQDIYDNWKKVTDLPYLIGDFMWTAWDYLGEAAIGSWNYDGISMVNIRYPWLLSCAGCFDIIGTPDAQAAYAATVWGKRSVPYIGVQPINHPGIRVTKAAWRGTNAFSSWSWRNCEGEKATIEIYADADSVELFLNNKKVGKKKLKKMKAVFKIPYRKGTLKAICLDTNGNPLGQSSIVSASDNLHVEITQEAAYTDSGLVFVDLTISDNDRIVESNADALLTVDVTDGELLGLGSAKPDPTLSYTGNQVQTYYGRALAVIRVRKDRKPSITVTESNGHKYTKEICL